MSVCQPHVQPIAGDRDRDDEHEVGQELQGRGRAVPLTRMSRPRNGVAGSQRFLVSLFELFDLEPRLAYSLEAEEIDGSITFDTDDYIVEARWRKDPVERGDADVFASKVRRKGKNALGLFVSVSGFTRGAINTYPEATPFMASKLRDMIENYGSMN